jgi:hypothetical protein
MISIRVRVVQMIAAECISSSSILKKSIILHFGASTVQMRTEGGRQASVLNIPRKSQKMFGGF